MRPPTARMPSALLTSGHAIGIFGRIHTAQFQSWNLITMKSAPSTGIACHKIRSDALPRSSAQFFCSIIGSSLFVAAAVAEAPDAPTNVLGCSAANAVKQEALD